MTYAGGGDMNIDLAWANWHKDYMVGSSDIDREHELLFIATNDFIKAAKCGYECKVMSDQLDVIQRYAQAHFDHEEAIMRKILYQDYRYHKDWHDEFMREIEGFQAEFAGCPNASQKEISTEVAYFLCNWHANHILCGDKHLGALFEATSPNKNVATISRHHQI